VANTGLPWELPYQDLTEPPNGPLAQQALAQQAASYGLGRAWPCTSTTRPAHLEGRIIFETDTGLMHISDGSAWNQLAYGDDTGWVSFTADFVAAANFTVTSTLGRRRNGLVGLYCNFTTTNAITAGNITNLTVGTLPAAFRTQGTVGGLLSGSSGPVMSFHTNSTGALILTATATALAAGDAFNITGTFMI
jgi:hypothetical protein